MKTIGLIGGMSWESTAEYYRIINESIREELGGLHSAKIVLYSFDFDEIEKLQNSNKWELATNEIIKAAKILENANADFVMICTNTMHKMAEEVISNINIPLLNIVDTVAEKAIEYKINKLGLLGTRFTMEESFYKERLKIKYDIDTIIPDKDDRDLVHNIIYKELCIGEVKNFSKEKIVGIIEKLRAKKAQGIILGCTELPLIIKQTDYSTPILDSTVIHSKAAVKFSLDK